MEGAEAMFEGGRTDADLFHAERSARHDLLSPYAFKEMEGFQMAVVVESELDTGARR